VSESTEHPVSEGPFTASLDRRQMLQRSAFVVGAAALWATPVVQTIGMRPAAATTQRICEDSSSGKPTRLSCRLTPNRYDQNPLPADQDTSGWKKGSANVLQVGPADARADFPLNGSARHFRVRVANTEGGLATATPGDYSEGAWIEGLPQSGMSGIAPNLWWRIELLDGPAGARDPVPGQVQVFGFHTSCSQPLDVGWRFASITVTGFER
jgi:hypothetical protein